MIFHVEDAIPGEMITSYGCNSRTSGSQTRTKGRRDCDASSSKGGEIYASTTIVGSALALGPYVCSDRRCLTVAGSLVEASDAISADETWRIAET